MVSQERKSKLAPFIKELRPLRDRHAELEAAYIEKKKMFDNTAAGLETYLFCCCLLFADQFCAQ